MASTIATRKLPNPALTGQLSASPGRKNTPPIATSTSDQGTPAITMRGRPSRAGKGSRTIGRIADVDRRTR